MKTDDHQMNLAQLSDPPRKQEGAQITLASMHLRSASFRGRNRPPRQHLTRPRLCWTRQELVDATGLCYRTIINLERRGLLKRIAVGVNVALYSDVSVQAIFSAPSQTPRVRQSTVADKD